MDFPHRSELTSGVTSTADIANTSIAIAIHRKEPRANGNPRGKRSTDAVTLAKVGRQADRQAHF